MTDFMEAVVDLATAPLPALFIVIIVVAILAAAREERKGR